VKIVSPKSSEVNQKPPVQWDAVDWSIQDGVLARMLGKSKQRLGQVRKALGKPKALSPLTAWIVENRNLVSGMRSTDILEIAPAGTTINRLLQSLHKQGIPFLSARGVVVDAAYIFAHAKVSASGCWNWTKYLNVKTGYGETAKKEYAHRASYRIFKGEIPAGLNVLHRCDNRACVNPDHLYAGTPQQNCIDRSLRAKRNSSLKLSPDLVTHIRELCKLGACPKLVAKDIGVSVSTIRSVVARKNWKHVA
jgi:hypothetical protein